MTRYASIWFPHLLTEHMARKKPELREIPFVLVSRRHGRMVIDSANILAQRKDIHPGMVLADGKALHPELEVLESEHGKARELLSHLAEWMIRYTPFVSVDEPDGLILDTTGCTHLWNGEMEYLEHIRKKMATFGYTIRAAIADTIGAAWALARYGKAPKVVPSGKQYDALQDLPAAALRLDGDVLNRLRKLGLQRIGSFINMPQSALRRRFGPGLPLRIGQALGREVEKAVPIKPVEPYQERLSCLDPISTATGISIALEQLLDVLCLRLARECSGLRHAVFRAFRIDGDIQHIEIGTVHPSGSAKHLFRLFEHKIGLLRPELGFETFVLEAPKVEAVTPEQTAFWEVSRENDQKIAELLDRITAKAGPVISRYLPAEHYWPEGSSRKASPLWEKTETTWRTDWQRPVHLLPRPETIEVTAVLPDYPPILFRYKGVLHHVVKSDGPERIEQEWWLSNGWYRDYYGVEDEDGARYWLFRSGPYDQGKSQWFIHGFFA